MIQASSSTVGGGTVGMAREAGCGASPAKRAALAAGAGCSASPPSARSSTPAPVTTPTTPASPNTSSARSAGSSASTGTYAAPTAMMPRMAR